METNLTYDMYLPTRVMFGAGMLDKLNEQPMPVYTFLESYDFSGKRIIPFCSHGNGMMGETVSNICKTCPDADVRRALSITYSGGSSLEREIRSWLEEHHLINN